jgi:hypothetical protein
MAFGSKFPSLRTNTVSAHIAPSKILITKIFQYQHILCQTPLYSAIYGVSRKKYHFFSENFERHGDLLLDLEAELLLTVRIKRSKGSYMH